MKRPIRERQENTEMQEYIKRKANHSLAILGKNIAYHGSGQFLNIRLPERYKK